jgi:hypothetical protein
MSGMWKMLAAVLAVLWLSGPTHAYTAATTGQWERKAEKDSTLLTLTEDNRLHLTIRAKELNVTLHGDYHVTRDGVLYGVVTSVESDDEELDVLIDQPFSFRCRVDEGALVIGACNGFGKSLDEKKHELQLRGRYRCVQATPGGAAPPPPVTTSASFTPKPEKVSGTPGEPISPRLVPQGP